MTDKEVKKMISTAYCVPETEKGYRFINEHEKRSCKFSDIIKNEFRYIGFKSILAGLLLCVVFLAVALKENEQVMWLLSSLIPISSLLPVSLVFRSEKYGMCELEAASRFSLRFVRLVRMLIVGVFSGLVILGGSIIFRQLWADGIVDVVMYILLPYFVSVWASLLIARKMHGKESTYFIPFVCIATGFMPTGIRELKNIIMIPEYIYVVLAMILLVEVVKECVKYVKERSVISWNLY